MFLTLSPEVAAQRGAYGEERYENLDTQTRVREQFALVAREVAARHGNAAWKEVSAQGTLEEVEDAVWGAVQAGLEAAERAEPVGKLWTR